MTADSRPPTPDSPDCPSVQNLALPRTRISVFQRFRLAAFTLIELLVVISIIIILMGLLFPAFRGVQDQAKKTQAKNDLTQIVTAVNAFYTEYGRYPTSATNDASAKYGAGGSSNGPVVDELRGKATGSNVLNTRQIVFLSPPDAKDQAAPRAGIKTSSGEYLDPWGTAYAFQFDADYDNQIANPYGASGGAGSDPIRQGAIAWSLGKDGNQDGNVKAGDDVISWQ